MKKALLTGGCGFVGSNLARRLLEDEVEVVIYDDLSRTGATENLQWLQTLGPLQFLQADTRSYQALRDFIKRHQPDAIFHLAGQVAMTTSLQAPRRDFETNVVGSFNLLEAAREVSPQSIIIYASSNKVYGGLTKLKLREDIFRYSSPSHPMGIDETFSLDFQTPYGCSKGAADQYMLDYARVYGLQTIVLRHSTIYGGRQRATFDQGWVGWFCQQALETLSNPERKPFTISGNGKQVRDLLYVDDAVDCYLNAAYHAKIASGHAFNIGGGLENSCSLLELFQILEQILGVRLTYETLSWRTSDQKFFVADVTKAASFLKWKPVTPRIQGIEKTLDWCRSVLRIQKNDL